MAVEERRIVVAVDESEESMHALSWFLKNVLSRNSQSTLTILHARRPVAVYPGVDKTSSLFSHDVFSSLERRDTEMATWVLEKATKMCSPYDVKVETRVEEGDPREVICEMVNSLKADLLVMGSRGYGVLARSIMGSVSNHCVQNANCPVLVVKMPKSSPVGSK
ncbi:hypothetical protein Nepgr_014970 [Nepenthes gracilis]|uniref:UspA domain-containing protein n=1 Tax=Nepenthes gracilis TaxID=150966 RepID=A0AAD3SM48_NEPGR|nr:hypothetical protein Nepgr_014970 [Nepenthes gracilis]